jgi:aspartate aminotransferase
MKSAFPPMTGRLQAVDESKTTRIFDLARQLRRQGKDIINLAVGEPDFETPAPVIDATRRALSTQATGYGPVAGLEALRSELATAFDGYGPENILVSNGAKQALYSLFQVLCNPGDEVILPRPCWVSFTEQIKLAGGRPVLVDTADHQLDPEAIEQAVTARTRILLVNTPNNPTGAVYSDKALAEAVRIARRHNLYLIADEAYQAFVFDDRHCKPLFSSCSDSRRLITVRSFSKTYAMTGFRIGYVAGPEGVVRGLLKFQSHLSGNVCTFAQHGAVAALKMGQSLVQQRCAILQQRRDLAYTLAQDLFGCIKPRGAFYLFPKVDHCLRPNETSEDLAMRLLQKAGVAVVPGEAFHQPGHLRISFGASEADLNTGFERIKNVL